jgi:hypothetical protein
MDQAWETARFRLPSQLGDCHSYIPLPDINYSANVHLNGTVT